MTTPSPDPSFSAARELFDRVCDLDPAARERQLASVDPTLAQVVRELLAEDSVDQNPLDTPPLGVPDPNTRIPQRIGRFQVLERIGVGGMGAVYKARQDSPDRLVALKVVRSVVVTPEIRRRFEYEAEVLGRLDHPGIARIFEAGTTDTGNGDEPWFAMELVEGRPVNRYVREERLDLNARLQLLAKICDAVQHAHQKGVIHRDLKPGNVLVDADGNPKVLDFGMATMTSSESDLETMHTREGVLIGTLPYMSPEQFGGDPAAIDTRADVYALGVLGYELFAGVLPHDFVGQAVAEAARVVVEDEPTRLGERESKLRGDVETIIGKAMAKDVDRRYASADDLASDLRRHLRNEPIEARPPTLSYQLAKFARRNRAFVGGIAAVFLALVAGVTVSTVLYVQKEEERQRTATARDAEADAHAIAEEARQEEALARKVAEDAQRDEIVARRAAEAAQAEEAQARGVAEGALELQRELMDNFVQILHAPTPWRSGVEVTMMEVLDAAVERTAHAFQANPKTRAHLLATFAATYAGLGLHDRALPLYEEALQLQESVDPDSVHALVARGSLGYERIRSGDISGLPLMDAAWEGLQKRDDDPVSQAGHLARMAEVYQLVNRLDDAAMYAEMAIELCGEDPPAELRSSRYLAWKALGDAKTRAGDFRGSIEALTRAFEFAEGVAGQPVFEALTLNSIAIAHAKLGDFQKAIEVMEDVLERMRALDAEEHEYFAIQLSNLASFHTHAGNPGRAVELFEESLALNRRLAPSPNRNEAITLGNLADQLRRSLQFERAEAMAREAVDMLGATFGVGTLRHAGGQAIHSRCLYELGRFDEAAEALAGALQVKLRETPDHPELVNLHLRMAEVCVGQGDWEQARVSASTALSEIARLTPDDEVSVIVGEMLLGLAQVMGGPEADASLSLEAYARASETLDDHDVLLWRARAMLGLAEMTIGLSGDEEGQARFDVAIERLIQITGPDDIRVTILTQLADH